MKNRQYEIRILVSRKPASMRNSCCREIDTLAQVDRTQNMIMPIYQTFLPVYVSKRRIETQKSTRRDMLPGDENPRWK